MKKFLADQSGATVIEYGLIAALISLAIIPALSAMTATVISPVFFDLMRAISSAL
jgi:Flp pilus assembly pilin Flp